MPIRDGKKYACESCIRGHRVSTCQHEDRELRLIPPKGRPVKQCEHCRTARKSKSHHGQCDCGSKKEKKDKLKVEVKTESGGCCCYKGESCSCGKGKTIEARIERSLKRPNQPVKSKPGSECKMTVFTNSHHKPNHRNNSGHDSGAPYKIPRPHTLHGLSEFAKTENERSFLNSLPRASDDMWLGQTSFKNMSPPSISRTNSNDSLEDSASGPFSFDFDQHFACQPELSKSRLSHLDTVSESTAESYPWMDNSLSADDYLTMSTTSPNFTTEFEWPVPSTTSFSPSDLPLTSGLANWAQTISHSGDSAYQSAPGLTSNSSLTHESDHEQSSLEYWSDSIPMRNASGADRWVQPEVTTLDSLLKNGGVGRNGLAGIRIGGQRHLSNSSAGTTINMGEVDAAEAAASILIPADSDGPEDATDDWSNTWDGDYSGISHQQSSANLSRDLNWLF